jgi:hypothetical protein
MSGFKIPGGAPPPSASPPDEEQPIPVELPREGGVLVLDAEIKRCIPNKNAELIDGVEYCEGWGDHTGMGIACVAVYDILRARARLFLDDNLDELAELIERVDCVVGYNNHCCDNKLLAAHGILIPEERSSDLFAAIKKCPNTRSGCGLEPMHRANFPNSTGKGRFDSAMAPVNWQQGRRGSVIDGCLNDMQMTAELLTMALAQGFLMSPVDGGLIHCREHLPIELVNYLPWHQMIPPDARTQ